MRGFIWTVLSLAIAGLGAAWFLTAPERLPEDAVAGLTGDPVNGETVFWASGCASCHTAPDSDDRLTLSGGQHFETDFGTFIAPNISPSPAGIGGWSLHEFAQAMVNGVSPDGRHYYPAFPYSSYRLAEMQDIADLYAFIQELPPSDVVSADHDLAFPFSIRRSVGGWKLLFLGDDFVVSGDLTPQQERGRYLSEALAHCGECHTPRGALGQVELAAWLGGAPNPVESGTIPNITPGALTWSEDEIAAYLRDGFTPEFDVVGGEMASVVTNLSNLSDADRAAIAAYLQIVEPVE